MRIAIVTTSYPSFAGDASGHFVEAEAEALARAGHHVDVYHPRCMTASDRAAPASTVSRISLPAGDAFGWPGFSARLGRDPRALLGAAEFALRVRAALGRARPYDRAIAHWLVPSAWPLCNVEPLCNLGAPCSSGAVRLGWLGELCASGRGMAKSLEDAERTSVAHGSDVRLVCQLGGAFARHVVRSLLWNDGQVRFVAEPLRQELARAVGPRLGETLLDRSFTEASALDVGPRISRSEARGRLGIDPAARVAVVVGRLVPSKRADVALAACAALPGCVPFVLGDGPLAEGLQRRFPDAQFLGRLPRDLTLSYIAAADVLVSASEAEGSPTAIREALALGTPVAAVPWGPPDPTFHAAVGLHLGTDLPSALRAAVSTASQMSERGARSFLGRGPGSPGEGAGKPPSEAPKSDEQTSAFGGGSPDLTPLGLGGPYPNRAR